MKLPEDVENVLKARGEKAAVKQLCRKHEMSRGAAMAWVASCSGSRLPVAEHPLLKAKIAALLMATFAVGMLLAALEKLL